MKDQFPKLKQKNFVDLQDGTSFVEYADGNMRSNLRDGREKDLLEPDLLLAKVSRSPENVRDLKTLGIYGRICEGSSQSLKFQQYLANRCLMLFPTDGGIEYALTWKSYRTPAGRRYYQLAASGRRTSDRDCSGWPTPDTQNDRDGTVKRKAAYGRHGMSLHHVTENQVDGWQTPAVDSFRTRGGNRKDELGLDRQAKAAGWPTPNCDDPNNATRDSGKFQSLTRTVQMAGWATTTARDHKDGTEESCKNIEVNSHLGRQAHLSPAATGSKEGYRLNPRFSLWLMGFPIEWAYSGGRVTRSSRKSQRSLSKP